VCDTPPGSNDAGRASLRTVPVVFDLPSGRLVFFFSDVEGSTRVLTELGDRFAALLGEHQRLVRGAFAAHDGVEISTEGDSFFAVFRAPVDAVAAAAAAQRSLAAHAWPVGNEFRIRVGLHVGRAILAGDNYVGIDVNRAARVANAANGGQVILSDEMADAVGGELPAGLALLDLGRHRLKDIGVARLWQLAIDGLPTPAGPLRSLEAHSTNLPLDATPLVDRAEETQALRRLIADNRLVAVTGTGGVGKSRLAVHVARSLVADFPDGVFYLDLAPIDRLETAVTELASLLNVRMPPSGDASDALLEHLRDRRTLLLLETADRHPGLAAFATRIAESCQTTRLLITARSALHLRIEREFNVQPLALPQPRPTLETASEAPAVVLFAHRARAMNPGFVLNADNLDVVAEIVRRLDGIPLAIELAAAAMRLLSPGAILSRLTRSLPLPGGAAVDTPERQRTLHDTIAWSYELFAPADQAILRRLSVFAGDFDLDGLEAVATDPEGSGADGNDGLEVLGRLVDGGLVHRVESPSDDRYRLLGMVREFAAAELAGAGDANAVRSRHAHYWLQVAMREGTLLDGPREMQALMSLDRAGDEFRTALEWAIGTGNYAHLGLRLASALARAGYLRGRVHEAAAWLERALAADALAPPEARVEALHWLGVMLDEQRDARSAIERLEEALAIQRDIGDDRAIARELNSLGVVHRNIGDVVPAGSLLNESLMRRRRLGDMAGVATVLTNLGILAIDRGHFDQAIELLEEAVRIDRASGVTAGVAYSSSALGTAFLRSGRRNDALGLLRSGLATFHELGDTDGVAEGLERLGEAAAADDPARSARLLLAARSIRERELLALRAIDESRANELFSGVALALSAEELASAQADARGMDLDAAVAYAFAERERVSRARG
jgi:predicted ATPase/class 3 adenylate cyclase